MKMKTLKLKNVDDAALVEFLRYAGAIGRDESLNGDVEITIYPPRYVKKFNNDVWASMNQDRIKSFGIKADIVVKDINS